MSKSKGKKEEKAKKSEPVKRSIKVGRRVIDGVLSGDGAIVTDGNGVSYEYTLERDVRPKAVKEAELAKKQEAEEDGK